MELYFSSDYSIYIFYFSKKSGSGKGRVQVANYTVYYIYKELNVYFFVEQEATKMKYTREIWIQYICGCYIF